MCVASSLEAEAKATLVKGLVLKKLLHKADHAMLSPLTCCILTDKERKNGRIVFFRLNDLSSLSDED